jgi:hypothetical protein
MGNSTHIRVLNRADNWVHSPKGGRPQMPDSATDEKMPGHSMVFSIGKALGTPDAFPYAAGTGKSRFQ